MAVIAFLGLGRMGSGMAARLVAAGHTLRLFNRTRGRAQALLAQGAVACNTPKEAARGADVVMSMVSDDDASRSLWLGPDGVFAARLARNPLAIECSTLSHGWVLELSAAAQGQGLRYIDAPVTGLPDSAAAGELTLLIGAEPAHLDAARPMLSAFSTRLLHFGPVGTGTVYKLLVNLLGAVQIASVGETLAIAERAGLNLSRVAEALATGQAASPQVVRNARRMAEGSHSENIVFTPHLRLKDVDYALRLTRALDVGSPFGSLAARLFGALCALEEAPVNESKIIDIARLQRPE